MMLDSIDLTTNEKLGKKSWYPSKKPPAPSLQELLESYEKTFNNKQPVDSVEQDFIEAYIR